MNKLLLLNIFILYPITVCPAASAIANEATQTDISSPIIIFGLESIIERKPGLTQIKDLGIRNLAVGSWDKEDIIMGLSIATFTFVIFF